MMMTDEFGFEAVLDEVLSERAGVAPVGLEQRLMARFAQEAERSERARGLRVFGFAESVRTERSSASMLFAMGAHVAVLLLVFLAARHGAQLMAPVRLSVTQLVAPVMAPPVALKAQRMGGGGGQHDVAPVTRGHLPKLTAEQIVPPKAPPMIAPKLAVEPSVVVQRDLKMADNALPNIGLPKLAVEPSVVVQRDLKMAESTMPNIGLPNSTLKGVSMGNGTGTGIGAGNGDGIGPGSGGNVGGGVFHIGGSVRAPVLTHEVDPEFSEQARKAKFSGNVQVYLVVDEQGLPTHVRVARGVGMGLDEKAVEAVRQYKFKPAMQNGKPVKVDLYIDVVFQIF